jgi:hypothetical protein
LIDDELQGNNPGILSLVMELGETNFSKFLGERKGRPIYLPFITLYFKQVNLAELTDRTTANITLHRCSTPSM